MSTKPSKPIQGQTVFGSDAAPVIYFDGAVAFGIRDGVVQIELGVNHLVPVDGGVKMKIVMSAHLRCSSNAALGLCEAIEKALAMVPPLPEKAN